MSYEEILKKYWGYDSFRGIQKEIIESIGSGKDTLGLMPTGGGKSIAFQVPALAASGVCVVITPLVALMKDQVTNLRKRGIKAACLHSAMTHDQILATLDNCVFGAVKILYVSPERLSSKIFVEKLRHIQVSFLAVDEAHCISQWGYDFRPSYLKIADIRHELPEVPVLALTATATPEVVDDIQDRLEFKRKNVFRMSFERKNLAYVVRNTGEKISELIHILKSTEGSAIVYVRNRNLTMEIADYLVGEGISAKAYHARLDDRVKDERQKEWQAGRLRVMVATNAFGMGIDKPDVRVVVHYECPESIEEYFQEAGRAGRDGKKAYAVMLTDTHSADVLRDRLRTSFPAKDYIREVYDHLAYYYQIGVDSGYNSTFEFDIDDFCVRFHHYPLRVEPALDILTLAGYIDYSGETEILSRVQFVVGRDELYRKSSITPDEDQLIDALLRNYTGLFVQYDFISEDFLAMVMKVGKREVCKRLIGLSRKHILSYIPHKTAAFIHYPQRREDSKHLMFPPAVYEERMQRAIKRTKSMLDYLNEKDVCRSVFLLRYFGEEANSRCKMCDICVKESKAERTTKEKRIRQAILAILDDGHERLALTVAEELVASFSHSEVGEVLRGMIADGELSYCDGSIALSR